MSHCEAPATEFRVTPPFARRLLPAIGRRPGHMGDHYPEQLALFQALVRATEQHRY
jgi:hypothetical protein